MSSRLFSASAHERPADRISRGKVKPASGAEFGSERRSHAGSALPRASANNKLQDKKVACQMRAINSGLMWHLIDSRQRCSLPDRLYCFSSLPETSSEAKAPICLFAAETPPAWKHVAAGNDWIMSRHCHRCHLRINTFEFNSFCEGGGHPLTFWDAKIDQWGLASS